MYASADHQKVNQKADTGNLRRASLTKNQGAACKIVRGNSYILT